MYLQINLRVDMTTVNKIKQYKKFFIHHLLTIPLQGTSFLIESFSEEKPGSLVAST